jgi:hypothetical protein
MPTRQGITATLLWLGAGILAIVFVLLFTSGLQRETAITLLLLRDCNALRNNTGLSIDECPPKKYCGYEITKH